MPNEWWKNFGELATLTGSFRDWPSNQAQIYGNGLHNIEIHIGVKIIDKRDCARKKPLALTPNDLRDNVRLYDFESGAALDRPWQYSTHRNEYTRLLTENSVSMERGKNDENDSRTVESGSVSDDGTVYVSLYLSCHGTFSKMFGVGLFVPGIGVFDTTRWGSSTLNGTCKTHPSPFKSPQPLYIVSRSPINYTENDIEKHSTTDMNRSPIKLKGKIYNGADRWLDDFEISSHYDSYYIGVGERILNVTLYVNGIKHDTTFMFALQFAGEYEAHQLFAHPFNAPSKTEKLGYAIRDYFDDIWKRYDLPLRRSITYNEVPNRLCFSQVYYGSTFKAFRQPGNAFAHDTWIEFQDIYGNCGCFNLSFTDDKKKLKISRRA